MSQPLLQRIALDGLEIAAPQIFGSIMLFPVIDPEPRNDLRLQLQSYDENIRTVDVDGRSFYASYIPHGFIVGWQRNGEVMAQYGATMSRSNRGDSAVRETPVFRHMARRIDRRRLRLLPLHLALEGFLALQFGGPSIAWTEWSRNTRNQGLGWRYEAAVSGRAVNGLDDALGLFEIHEGQVGVLVFDTGVLLSAFVAACPDDYRSLHHTLIEDFFGELLFRQASMESFATVNLDIADREAMGADRTSADKRAAAESGDGAGDGLITLAALERAVADVRNQWEDLARQISVGLIDQPVISESVYRLSSFRLERFRTELDLETESHIGEAIVDKNGRIRYLKTFRLSKAQTRRGALLQLLGKHDWNLDEAAASQSDTRDQFVLRIENAGFGYLLNPEVLAQAQRSARQRRDL